MCWLVLSLLWRLRTDTALRGCVATSVKERLHDRGRSTEQANAIFSRVTFSTVTAHISAYDRARQNLGLDSGHPRHAGGATAEYTGLLGLVLTCCAYAKLARQFRRTRVMVGLHLHYYMFIHFLAFFMNNFHGGFGCYYVHARQSEKEAAAALGADRADVRLRLIDKASGSSSASFDWLSASSRPFWGTLVGLCTFAAAGRMISCARATSPPRSEQIDAHQH